MLGRRCGDCVDRCQQRCFWCDRRTRNTYQIDGSIDTACVILDVSDLARIAQVINETGAASDPVPLPDAGGGPGISSIPAGAIARRISNIIVVVDAEGSPQACYSLLVEPSQRLLVQHECSRYRQFHPRPRRRQASEFE